jgi:hypothetical protein
MEESYFFCSENLVQKKLSNWQEKNLVIICIRRRVITKAFQKNEEAAAASSKVHRKLQGAYTQPKDMLF